MPRCKDCSLFHPIEAAQSLEKIPATESPGDCYLAPPTPIVWAGKVFFVRPELRAEDHSCSFHQARSATIIPPKLAEDLN